MTEASADQPSAGLQAQARALGNATRHAIFRHVAAAREPIGVAALTEHFGIHHNAVRQHLAKLVAVGLLDEDRAPGTGPGRPRLVYTVAPSARGRWGTEGPYTRLSRLLVEVIRTGAAPEEVGLRHAAELAPAPPSGDPLAHLHDEMASQGFDPELREARGRTELLLHTCPFEAAAVDDRDTVCAIHLGIAHGLTAGTDLAVDELVAYDPRKAGCRLRVRRGDTTATRGTAPRPTGALTIRGRPAPSGRRS